MHPPLKIALDPGLRSAFGPELTWAWRLLLTSLGRAWTEVPADAECDIAHLQPGSGAEGRAAIVIRADPELWRRRDALALRTVKERDGWSTLDFADGDGGSPLKASEGGVEIRHDLLFDLFWLASASAERGWEHDRHGQPQPSGPLLRERAPTRALGSRIITRLEQEMRGLGLGEGVPKWPQGRRASACLTHDVDYPEVVRWLEPVRVIGRRRHRGLRPALDVALGRRSTWHFDSWTRLEQRWGARSAFYFVARKGSLLEYATTTPDSFYDIRTARFREAFRRLIAAGAEIGLHASYRAFESEARFAAEKQRLEQAAATTVAGNRHHYLHLDPSDPEETLLMHERLGFSYDTTLGYDKHLGWRNGLAEPFFPFHSGRRREIGTLQLPFAWMDQQLLSYGELNPGDPAELLQGLAETTAEHGGCLVANIHEYTFDPELFPGWSATYERLVRHLGESGEFWIATPREVAEHWRARARGIAEASTGLEAGTEPVDAAVAAR